MATRLSIDIRLHYMSKDDHKPEPVKDLSLKEAKCLIKQILDDRIKMVLEKDLPKFKPFVKNPKVPINFIDARLISYNYCEGDGFYRTYFDLDEWYNDRIKKETIVTKKMIKKLRVKIEVISPNEFKIKMIKQKLKDFKEQWEYYRKVLCTCYTPDELFKRKVVLLEETDTAWSIYEKYKSWENDNK